MTTPNPTFSLQRCFNHGLREAAVRCPECRRFFCRECVTEHEDRAICASCLKKLTAPGLAKQRAFSTLKHSVQLIIGILVAWFFFFGIGEVLLRLPASFHDTSLWRPPWIESE